eukprot:2410474-Pyramimonas_sp.AAC.1
MIPAGNPRTPAHSWAHLCRGHAACKDRPGKHRAPAQQTGAQHGAHYGAVDLARGRWVYGSWKAHPNKMRPLPPSPGPLWSPQRAPEGRS